VVEVLRIEWEVRLERSAFGLDITQNVETLFVPVEVPGENCRQNNN